MSHKYGALTARRCELTTLLGLDTTGESGVEYAFGGGARAFSTPGKSGVENALSAPPRAPRGEPFPMDSSAMPALVLLLGVRQVIYLLDRLFICLCLGCLGLRVRLVQMLDPTTGESGVENALAPPPKSLGARGETSPRDSSAMPALVLLLGLRV